MTRLEVLCTAIQLFCLLAAANLAFIEQDAGSSLTSVSFAGFACVAGLAAYHLIRVSAPLREVFGFGLAR